jgi:hypothetical protein
MHDIETDFFCHFGEHLDEESFFAIVGMEDFSLRSK